MFNMLATFGFGLLEWMERVQSNEFFAYMHSHL